MSSGTGLLYWAASGHKLFLYWPVSTCAYGREGVGRCKSRPSSTGLGADLLAQGGICVKGGGRAVEGILQGCGGERNLRTTGWQQRK